MIGCAVNLYPFLSVPVLRGIRTQKVRVSLCVGVFPPPACSTALVFGCLDSAPCYTQHSRLKRRTLLRREGSTPRHEAVTDTAAFGIMVMLCPLLPSLWRDCTMNEEFSRFFSHTQASTPNQCCCQSNPSTANPRPLWPTEAPAPAPRMSRLLERLLRLLSGET